MHVITINTNVTVFTDDISLRYARTCFAR